MQNSLITNEHVNTQNTPASWQQFAELSNSATKAHPMLKPLCQLQPSPHRLQPSTSSITVTRDWKPYKCPLPGSQRFAFRNRLQRPQAAAWEAPVQPTGMMNACCPQPPQRAGCQALPAAGSRDRLLGTLVLTSLPITCNGGQTLSMFVTVLWAWGPGPDGSPLQSAEKALSRQGCWWQGKRRVCAEKNYFRGLCPWCDVKRQRTGQGFTPSPPPPQCHWSVYFISQQRLNPSYFYSSPIDLKPSFQPSRTLSPATSYKVNIFKSAPSNGKNK